MTIGIDLRSLQIGHQYRGIGEVVKRVLGQLFPLVVQDNDAPAFIFYQYDDEIDPLKFLQIPDNLDFSVVKIGPRPLKMSNRTLMNKFQSKFRFLYGNPIPQTKSCDVFLQFDFQLGLPTNTHTVLAMYDLIPLIFWNDFFTSPWVHFRNKAARTTLRTWLHNYEYKHTLKRTNRLADKIIAISQHTKSDLEEYLKVSSKKIEVVYLGVSQEPTKTFSIKAVKPWPTKPYLLFVGAVDPRRREVDAVIAAYNNLKADGHDIQLVLAGENFPSPEAIPNHRVRQAVTKSSYLEDILTVGYISDEAKAQLFQQAIAFVFPSRYEGFGLPILEAMVNDCPVITYSNSSITEVAGKYALYAEDWEDIKKAAETILSMSLKQRIDFIEAAHHHALKFSWPKTSQKFYDILKSFS